jgi:hypothetical protein
MRLFSGNWIFCSACPDRHLPTRKFSRSPLSRKPRFRVDVDPQTACPKGNAIRSLAEGDLERCQGREHSCAAASTEAKAVSRWTTPAASCHRTPGDGVVYEPKPAVAFIYYYTKIHGCAPSEAEMLQYFRVSPPAVHQVILALGERGLIGRAPGRLGQSIC